MATTNVTLRIDQDVKRKADQLFTSLGLTFSGAVNVFLQKAIREQGIPFEVSTRCSEEGLSEQALVNLLASAEAQRKIGSIHEGSIFEAGSILPSDNLEKYL